MNNFAACTLAAALFGLLVGGVNGQVLDPIAVSFGTVTGEVDSALGLPIPGDEAGASKSPIVDALGNSYYLFLQGDYADFPTDGLPADGTIVSASNSPDKTTTFRLAPYSGPNVLISDGTLTLATPGAYSNLAFLVNSLTSPSSRFGGEPATFTLNFSDGTSTTLSTQEDVPYWLGGEPGAPGSSVALSTGALYDEVLRDFDQTTVNFDEYDFALSPTDAAKTLESIDVGANSGGLLTYAVSGTLSSLDPPADPPMPEPPTGSLLLATSLGAFLLRRLPSTARA